MDRTREARRPSIVGSNGFNRRRHRTNTLRDSPDDDGGLELQDTLRLRDRLKKDRDRDRDRDRETERDLRERSCRSKRRRAERLTNNIGVDETSEESVNDEEEEEDEETPSASAVRILTPVVGAVPNHHHHGGHINNTHHSFSQQQHNSNSTSSNITNSTNHHHLQHRKTSPSSASGKIFRTPVWKSGDEMISVSVPRKARSASTKRSHEWISSNNNNNSGGGGGGEKIVRQVSGSPVRQGLAAPISTPLPAAPLSPSSSNSSLRKKLKPSVNHIGPKLKPPKGGSSSKLSSSNPEELEIEIAEVLYGLMTQSQAPSSKKEESGRDVNRSNNSSPISNSTSTAIPISACASKRRGPRQIPDTTDRTPKSQISSHLVKTTEENGCEIGGNSINSQGLVVEPPLELVEVKPVDEELRERKDLMASKKDEEVCAPKDKESAAVKAEDTSKTDSQLTATTSVINTVITMVSDVENHKEEKFEIDLMVPPRQVKLSPERELRVDSTSESVHEKKVLSVDSGVIKEKEDKNKRVKDHLHLVAEENKCEGTGEVTEPHKGIENGGRTIDLEKPERDGIAGVNVSGDKLQVQSQKNLKLPVKATREETLTEKSGHVATSLPLPMSVASWPGGLPSMGYGPSYMAPLQGVVSMDASTVTPAPIQPLFSQPRPKRCATHCHIARNIHCLQQFMKMNPFWPAPAGPAALFGSKHCSFSVMPSVDLQGNIPLRGVGNVQEKGQSLASTFNNGGIEKCSQPVSVLDPAPAVRKQQFMIQQALPPVAPNNLLGPAFIFPLNQQQAAVAAMPGAPKSAAAGTSTNASNSGSGTSVSSTSVGSAAAGMSFNYPNVAANETQYLAVLQNGGYPFPIPAVGAPSNYRGAPAQAMPLFNGSYFSSQMIHPSQLQHSQPTSNQQWQLLQTQQNTSPSNGSSSQKHLHSQQQRPQGNGLASYSGNANKQNLVGQKIQQPQQLQPSLNQNQYRLSSRPRQVDCEEMGNEDSPSTTDGRGSRASVNIYGSNFAMPIYPQSHPLIAPPTVTMSGNSNQSEKRAHQTQQSGVESLPVQSFAMSFGPINGTTAGAGIDMSSVPQNHGMFKNSTEATRQNIQLIAAAAQVAQNYRTSEDGKSGHVDSSAADDERKSLSGKALSGLGQSITFTRSEMADGPIASVQANNVIETSVRSPNLASGPSRSSRTVTTNVVGAINLPNVHIQQPQQLATTAVNLSKVQAASNGSIFPEHFTSSSAMNAKFSNALSGFPQNFVQSNSGSPVQAPQWRTSTRPSSSPAPSSLGSSPGTLHKNLHQQQSRTQPQIHNQISFGGSQKPSSMSQGLAPPSSNQGPASPMMVGSPTTSTISKGASGSPRTSASSTTNKMGQTSSMLTQQPKNVAAVPSQKSPSILGNPHMTSSSSSNTAKPQIQQQPQQHPKTIQQAQLFFSSPCAHSPSPHSASTSSTTSSPGGYYMQQRRRPEQHQQSPGAPVTSSTGVLSVCPVTLSGMSTNDPAKAIAAATGNMKDNIMQASQFTVKSTGTILPAGFSYVQPIPAAVPVKTAEQKQPPIGRENLHARQSEKK